VIKNLKKFLNRINIQGVKTQMGTTLSSCSHFIAFELLQRQRQATVIMVGHIVSFFLLAHSVASFCNPSLLNSAFYSIILQLSFRRTFRFAFPDGVSYRVQHRPSLAISTSAIRNFSGFSAFLLPGTLRKTRISLLFRPLTQPSKNDKRFFRSTEPKRSLFLPNL
jgi:hypothetical protein